MERTRRAERPRQRRGLPGRPGPGPAWSGCASGAPADARPVGPTWSREGSTQAGSLHSGGDSGSTGFARRLGSEVAPVRGRRPRRGQWRAGGAVHGQGRSRRRSSGETVCGSAASSLPSSLAAGPSQRKAAREAPEESAGVIGSLPSCARLDTLAARRGAELLLLAQTSAQVS